MSNFLDNYKIKEKPLTSVIALNILTIILALIFDWRTFDLMLIFWTENIVLGIFNVIRMITLIRKMPSKAGCSVIFIPFFMFHYFAFCIAHGLIIVHVLAPQSFRVPGLFGPIFALMLTWAFLYGFIMMSINQGLLLKTNFIDKKEYIMAKIPELMTEPYRHIFVSQFLSVGIAVFILKNGADSFLMVILLVVVKSIFDIYVYNKEVNKKTKRMAEIKAYMEENHT